MSSKVYMCIYRTEMFYFNRIYLMKFSFREANTKYGDATNISK